MVSSGLGWCQRKLVVIGVATQSMRIIEGVGIGGGVVVAVAIVCGRLIDFNFKRLTFFCCFGHELSASFSGDEEEDDPGNNEHTRFNLDFHAIKFSPKNTNAPTMAAGTALRRIWLVGLAHAAELGSDSSQARR